MLLMGSKHRLQISSAVAGWADFSFFPTMRSCFLNVLSWSREAFTVKGLKNEMRILSEMSLEGGRDGAHTVLVVIPSALGAPLQPGQSYPHTWLQIQEKMGPNSDLKLEILS